MMDYFSFIGIIAGFFSFISYPFYFVAIIKGKTKPHVFTWGALAFLQATSLFFYSKGGAEETIYIVWADLIGITFAAFFSLYKEKEWKFSMIDWGFFLGALLSIVIYLLYHNAFWAFTISLGGEILALIPTLLKAYKKPEEEDFSAWMFINIANFLGLIIIQNAIETVYMVSIFIIDFLIFIPLILWKIKNFKNDVVKHHS